MTQPLYEYRVVWEIQVEAPSPEAAAKLAKRMMEDDHAECDHFTVHKEMNYIQGRSEGRDIDLALDTRLADQCPSDHWNDGTDFCADCGEPLNW